MRWCDVRTSPDEAKPVLHLKQMDAAIGSENFGTRNEPSIHLIDATSFVKIWNATIEAEELANISNYDQTL